MAPQLLRQRPDVQQVRLAPAPPVLRPVRLEIPLPADEPWDTQMAPAMCVGTDRRNARNVALHARVVSELLPLVEGLCQNMYSAAICIHVGRRFSCNSAPRDPTLISGNTVSRSDRLMFGLFTIVPDGIYTPPCSTRIPH